MSNERPVTAEIHRLTGAGPIAEPVASVIERLEELLDRARRGEIKGLGYFLVDGADSVSTDWLPGCACGNDMSAGAGKLFHRVMQTATETE